MKFKLPKKERTLLVEMDKLLRRTSYIEKISGNLGVSRNPLDEESRKGQGQKEKNTEESKTLDKSFFN